MPFSPIIVIVGPTASGKSALAVRLAHQFNGEIISADSRQVYRGLNIGSGKITKREMRGIPHYLLDVANPRKVFTVSQYQKLAGQVVENIIRRGKLPIICGGTGFYIDALLGRVAIPPVPPDPKLRHRLEKLDDRQLFQKLEGLAPDRAKKIDRRNRRRLMRAIEIAQMLNTECLTLVTASGTKGDPWDSLQIGIRIEPEKLRQNIHTRLLKRLRLGLIAEVKKLRQNGLSWKRLEALGLEYRFIAKLLREQERDFRDASEPVSKRVKREKIAFLKKQLSAANWHYTKRQLTWWKRDKTIHWIKNSREAERLVARFITVKAVP